MQVKVINPCKAEGVFHQPDAIVELEDEDAQALINSGAVVKCGEAPVFNRPEDADVLNAAIRDAVALLDEDAMTQSGKAKTEALRAVLGYEVTAAERDAAMAAA